MELFILGIFMWLVAIVAIIIMKKIQPENKVYPIWAVFICILFTLFLIGKGF